MKQSIVAEKKNSRERECFYISVSSYLCNHQRFEAEIQKGGVWIDESSQILGKEREMKRKRKEWRGEAAHRQMWVGGQYGDRFRSHPPTPP